MTTAHDTSPDNVLTPAGTFTVRTWGGHVTQWDAPGFGPLLYVSSAANHTPGVALRGGVPVCFPWFAKGPDGSHTPSHGFARLSEWAHLSTTEDAQGNLTVTHELTPTQAAAADGIQLFPHPFHATHTAEFTATTLTISLTVVNTGDNDFTFEEALHTYLAVSTITDVSVFGLDGEPFTEDGATGTQEGPLTFGERIDRIYTSMHPVTLADPGANRTITITKTGSRSTVVWNPGPDLAATMPDIGHGEWERFVCIESGNIGDNAITVKPGQGHTLTAKYEVSPIEPIEV